MEVMLKNATLIFNGERGVTLDTVICSAKKVDGTVIGALPGESVWIDKSAARNVWVTKEREVLLRLKP
ncbi:MAG: hypothetical protein OEV86_15965 [Candidatus Krumholzibacteria bacterium]|nr:hypothetical protein [Candidatus Krumholzibacteria bacterium]